MQILTILNKGFVNTILLYSLFLTYKQLRVLRNKEVTRGNRRIAWLLYSFSVIGLVVVNIYFS